MLFIRAHSWFHFVGAAKARPPQKEVIFDGEFAAKLTQLACSEAPEGRVCWTIRLLAEKLVEIKIGERVSAMTDRPQHIRKQACASPEQILEDSAR